MCCGGTVPIGLPGTAAVNEVKSESTEPGHACTLKWALQAAHIKAL